MLFLSHQNLVTIYDVDAPLKGVAASAVEGVAFTNYRFTIYDFADACGCDNLCGCAVSFYVVAMIDEWHAVVDLRVAAVV